MLCTKLALLATSFLTGTFGEDLDLDFLGSVLSRLSSVSKDGLMADLSRASTSSVMFRN